MKILAFDSLDSTSTQAGRLLDDNVKPPFAVIASQQTGGRGRSGRSWESPKGGLYLTLVLDPSLHPDPQNPGSLPLWVAAETASFFYEKFALRLTIKWPNDLLFAGKKLGGILCEGRMHGKELGPLIIGIGINLHSAPDVTEQESVSLETLLRKPFEPSPLSLGQELSEYLFQKTKDKSWRRSYSAFALESGQLYAKSDGETSSYYSLYEAKEDGGLELIDLKTRDAVSLNSVSHGFRWVYQKKNPMLVADIGNSLIKIGYFAEADQKREASVRLDLRDENYPKVLKEFLTSSFPGPKPWVMHGITVASRPWEKLSEALREHSITLIPVPKRSLRVNFERYNFAQLGIDRVALSEAAVQVYPNQPILVVSAGTAITIEALSADGVYLGGYILPGLQSKLNSLHLRTDRLPLLKVYEEKIDELPLFGRNTKEAMMSGLIHESIALIDYLKRQLSPEEPRIVFTGGDGEILARAISGDYHESLTLEGIRLMAKGGSI